MSISLRLILDSGVDGIPGCIGTARLSLSDPEECGSGRETVARSRSRSLLKSRDRSRERRFQCSKDFDVKRRPSGCVLCFYRMVETIMLRRLGPSVITGIG